MRSHLFSRGSRATGRSRRRAFSPLSSARVSHALASSVSVLMGEPTCDCRSARSSGAPLRQAAILIRVCVAGVTGWTGRPVAAAVEAASDLELVAGVSRSDPDSYSSVAEALDAVSTDVLVDFTHAAVVRGNVLAALERSVNVVVGSSGLSAADYEEIDVLARKRRVGVIAAGNFSLTAALLLRSAVAAARRLEAWEVIDYAKAGKPDAPSGTARELA